MTTKPGILDWTVPVKDLARNGVRLSYEADDNELEAIRLACGLHTASHLRLEADLRQDQRGLITVTGKLVAAIEQNCVVTLKPVGDRMAIAFDRLLLHEAANGRRKKKKGVAQRDPGGEVVFEPLEDDPPDILVGNNIDLGEIALEEFSLGLNPYPRHGGAPGAVKFSYPADAAADERDQTAARPFAVLKKYHHGESGD